MAKRKKKRAAASGGGARRCGITVSIAALEIARGHDGLLRGRPEPVIVLSALLLDGGAPRLIGRAAHAFRVGGAFPCVAQSDAGPLRALASLRGSARVIVVAAALERDDGSGVAATYAALAEPTTLLAWWPHAALPDPRALVDLATPGDAAPAAAPVRLLREGRDLDEGAGGDDWIGACLGVVDVERLGVNERLRLRFADAAGRNDWTALVDVRLA